MKHRGIVAAFLGFFIVSGLLSSAGEDRDLDARVRAFLNNTSIRWWDMNVPASDGELLYQIVLENSSTKALEIGTSTGRSAIYIAWALSKTGGKLTTIEIDEGRYRQALANFKAAGLEDFIDARLADAHELVPKLEGPFDFVFIDADKDWYVNYAKALIPKILPGGCISAHNVTERRWGRRGGGGGTAEYYEFMQSLPDFETRILPEGSGSLAVSFKKN
jgi:caffeoyl-CoA O-methyltransferase